MRDATGRRVTVTRGFDRGSNQLTIALRERWLATTYTVTLGRGVEDLAGNPLAAAYSWFFTVEPP